ncbi:flagellar hook-length control protein FliK [Paucibacter sediminis]|uniref:Flagellar hook-length control protein FliK n=1 Tax=Paucibacter sediminis TaxID=3019553 RepID=A0AA95NAG5_9BURK|nr:flagellar hook-length control protein FliK [Paucibacter sp. S2-9]WIT11397.1 flagellar hook-length control protein FliK [Paucibacter sp. S2-9]
MKPVSTRTELPAGPPLPAAAAPTQAAPLDEAGQLAQDFASALAAMVPALPVSPAAPELQADPAGDQLRAELQALLRMLQQGPAGEPPAAADAAASSERATEEPATPAQDMPAMDGLMLALLPNAQPSAQPSAPPPAEPASAPPAHASAMPEASPAMAVPTVAGAATLLQPAMRPAAPATGSAPAPARQQPGVDAIPPSAGQALAARFAAVLQAAVPAAKLAQEPGAKAEANAAPALDASLVANVQAPAAWAKPAAAVAAPAATLALPQALPSQWQQPLLLALGDRLQLQIAARSEQAVIRLEPPLLGRVEIAIQQQGGELQVRLSASHPEVTRQLQHISAELRQELALRQPGEVQVQVAQRGLAEQDAQSGRQQPQAEAEAAQRPGRALHEGGDAPETGPRPFAQRLGAQIRKED